MREVQYRLNRGQWQPLGAFARAVLETRWRPPASGRYRFRHRLADRNGDPLSQWGYSEPLDFEAAPPPPVYGAVAADGCPPAERGVHGQLWIAPDGRVWRHSALFASPPPDQATVTPDGVDGVWWGTDGLALTGSRASDYQFYVQGADRQSARFDLADALSASGAPGFHVDQLVYWPEASATVVNRRKVRFGAARGVYRLGDDLKPELEKSLFVALRVKGQPAVWLFDDDDEPYVSSTPASTRVDALFAGAVVVDVRVGRKDRRCPTDPLNPWVPEESLGVVGLDGRGVEWIHSLASSDAAIPAGEIPPNTLPYDAARSAQGVDQGVRIVGGAVSQAAAGGRVWFDEERQTSAANPFDTAMWRTVPGQPARGAVPDDTWGGWQGPVFRRLWGADGEDGDDGEDGLTTEQAFAVTAGNRRPAALAAGLDYRASPEAASPPVAGRAYRTRPDLSDGLPFGWVNERAVSGQPDQGDDVGDVAWDGWALAEHFGDDGDPGEDGVGIEWIHSPAASADPIPSSEQPADTVAYDAARSSTGSDQGFTAGGRTWYDEQQAGTAAKPFDAAMFRRVPGIPDRGDRPPTPLKDGWGPWRGPVFQRLFVPDPVDPVTVDLTSIDAVIPWDSDDDDWSSGLLFNQRVTWRRGATVVDAIDVRLDSRDSRGTAQCRLTVSFVDTTKAVYLTEVQAPGGGALSSSRRRRTRLRRSQTVGSYAAAPRNWLLEVAGLSLPIAVRAGVRPPAPVEVTMVSTPTYGFYLRGPYSRSETVRVTWTKGSARRVIDVTARARSSAANVEIFDVAVAGGTLGRVAESAYAWQSSSSAQRTYTVDGVDAVITAVDMPEGP